MKLFLREEGSEAAQLLWANARSLASSRVLSVEAFAALAAARRAERLGRRALERARKEVAATLEEIDLVELEPRLAAHAALVAEQHRLGALDAVHLASALARGDADLVVASWDRELRRAAGEAGFAVAPAYG